MTDPYPVRRRFVTYPHRRRPPFNRWTITAIVGLLGAVVVMMWVIGVLTPQGTP